MSSTDHDRLLSAGRAIAHDLRNVFAVITACATDLYDEMQGRQAAALVLEILNASEQGLHAATELLRLGGEGPDEMTVLDLVSQVDAVAPLLRRLAPPDAHVEVVASVDAAWVSIDRTSLLQILTNLVANAADASPPGAPITVVVSRTRRRVEAHLPIDVASILVSDEGTGIDADMLPRVFDDGFSTKDGAHWGIGLAVVRRVVERCAGWIDVRSDPERGTTVEVQLPLTRT